MWTIAKKEISIYFSSNVGYLSIGSFLTVNSLFLWFFDTDFNILNSGFADLTNFFLLAPWLLIFLIPAICMRSFSAEKQAGTLELILTKPISIWGVILGKYIGCIVLNIFALLPTLLYLVVLEKLRLDYTSLNYVTLIAGYFGLICISSTFISFGILCSVLSKNEVSAYISSCLLCFVNYYMWKEIAELNDNERFFSFIDSLGIFQHYSNIHLGIINISDIVYFICINYLTLYLINQSLLKLKRK